MKTTKKIAIIAAIAALIIMAGIAGKMDSDYEAERSGTAPCHQAQITESAEVCR